MHIPLNDLSRKSATFVDDITNSVRQVVESGRYFNGPHTKEFVSWMSSRLQSRNFLPLANGTDALILALEVLNLPTGSHVAMTPNAGGYACIAAVRAGLIPRFIDIDPTTCQMDSESLRVAFEIDKNISAVIITHLYGLVGEVSSVQQLCEKQKVALIEDCAQAFGASVDGQSVGTFGDIATFSFYPTKNLGAFGDAGGISCRDAQVFEKLISLSQYGWRDRYQIEIDRGFNSRMDEIQAAILCTQLKTLDADNSRRREIVLRYQDSLDSSRRMIQKNDQSFIGHLAIMVTPTRDADIEKLQARGIAFGIHYPTLDYDQKAWTKSFSNSSCPVSESAVKTILTLPCFPSMSQTEIDTVAECLQELGS
jgi:dTDP-4-amino-4,6-dideoxygalactose transaminase